MCFIFISKEYDGNFGICINQFLRNSLRRLGLKEWDENVPGYIRHFNTICIFAASVKDSKTQLNKTHIMW